MGNTVVANANEWTKKGICIPYSTEPFSTESINTLLYVQQHLVKAQMDQKLSLSYQIQTPMLDCLGTDLSFDIKIDPTQRHQNIDGFKVLTDQKNANFVSVQPVAASGEICSHRKNTHQGETNFFTTQECTNSECDVLVTKLNEFAKTS